MNPDEAAALLTEAGALGRPCACSRAPELTRRPQQLLLLCLCWLSLKWQLKRTIRYSADQVPG